MSTNRATARTTSDSPPGTSPSIAASEATSVTPFSPRAMDRALPAVTVALARLGVPELTPMLAAGSVENHGTETAALARAVGERARKHADGLPDGFGAHVGNRVQSLFDDWAGLAHEAGQGGVAFGYARGRDSGTSTPLLREMIDPNRDLLNDTQLRFRAPAFVARRRTGRAARYQDSRR